MKRLSGSLIFILFSVATLSAATVTVTKPAANETWVKGQTYQILWTKSGDMPDLVRISLRDQTSANEVKLIADNQPNSGSYSWTVGQDIADGQYVVRVKVKNVAVSDDSDVFHIAAVAGPSITVTKPAAGDAWNKNKTYAITWTKSGTMPNSVKIDLLNATGVVVVQPIADNQPNSGTYSWTVPGGLSFGNYRVRVQVKTTAIQDSSDVFSVAVVSIPAGSQPAVPMGTFLKVVYPVENSAVTNGNHLTIKFNAHTLDGDWIEIELWNEAETHRVMYVDDGAYGPGQKMPPVPGKTNQYYYDWVVPFGDNLGPGYYKIRLHSVGANLTDFSPRFYMTWPMVEKEYLLDAQAYSDFICITDTTGLTPPPNRPQCEPYNPNHHVVGWDVFDYPGSVTWADGEVHPFWRTFIHHGRLIFPMAQFQGKKIEVLQAQLRLKKECTVNVNTNLASAAGWLYRLESNPVPGQTQPNWSECQGIQKYGLSALPPDLTEQSFYVTQTVEYWINGTKTNYGFMISVTNPNPPGAVAATCKSAYSAKLYIKVKEEFKGTS